MPKILVAIPSYDGWRCNGAALFTLGRSPYDITLMEYKTSLLAKGFNVAWAIALEKRETAGVTHFMLLHADIKPEDPDWFDVLFKEMQRVGADIISAISPIKDSQGVTSTAIETDDLWVPRRITIKEALEKPETWTDPKLLFNTGMLLMDIRGKWTEGTYFTINDRIRHDGKRYVVSAEPEDWFFSRLTRQNGAKAWVTRKVKLRHEGSFDFPNYASWIP
jgi:hypothetical protein